MTAMLLALILISQGASSVRPGTVAGQLRTLEGSAAVAVRVGAIPAPSETTRPSFGAQYYFTEPPVSAVLTDNQGRYRLANVPPGRYFIVAGETYYPSTLDPDRATVLTVTPDSTTENIDFQLQRRVGGKVSGRVTPKPDTAALKAILSGVELRDILEVPVAADGSFEFGHVPTGAYFAELAPPFPGMGTFRVEVTSKDITGLELVRPPTHAVTGRIVVQNGPLPRAILAFHTPKSYVGATIGPDGTFSARLHSATHLIELAGMPAGYSVLSVRAGSQDVTKGLRVGNADVPGVVITVAAPRQLPRLRGRIAGLSNPRLSSARVELTGPITGSLESSIRPDGSFDFAALTPGMYRLRLTQVPEFTPMNVVVSWTDTEVQLMMPAQ